MSNQQAMPLTQRLHRSFMDLNEVQRKHYQYIKARYNVSGIEMEIIQWIVLNGKKKMKEISEHFNVKFSTLTNIVDKIEAQKYVARKNSKEDRRVVYLEVSKKGQRLYENYTKHIQVMAQLMSQEMENDHFDILVEGLEKMAEFAGQP
ncbi:MAG: MarR family winged helix-turn-helix transcriptional regulator [Bacteroidota bacterium]